MIQYVQETVLPYIRHTLLPSKPVQLLIKTGAKWDQDNCPGMAAALSYYALFSLFPMLLVIFSIIGLLIGPRTETYQYIENALEQYLPPQVHDLIRDTLISLNENSVGAGLIGFGLLLFTSSTIFRVLRGSFNKIWQSPSRVSDVGSPIQMVFFFLKNQIFSFLLVFAVALLLVVSLISDIVIKTLLKLLTLIQSFFPYFQIDQLLLTKSLHVGSSFLILAISLCILYKILPCAYVTWNDVWLSALLVALLLVGLQQLVTNSVISIGERFLSYGVIGSVMILMMWIFFTFQIILLGCVLSYTYAQLNRR
jgi:membrane protein